MRGSSAWSNASAGPGEPVGRLLGNRLDAGVVGLVALFRSAEGLTCLNQPSLAHHGAQLTLATPDQVFRLMVALRSASIIELPGTVQCGAHCFETDVRKVPILITEGLFRLSRSFDCVSKCGLVLPPDRSPNNRFCIAPARPVRAVGAASRVSTWWLDVPREQPAVVLGTARADV